MKIRNILCLKSMHLKPISSKKTSLKQKGLKHSRSFSLNLGFDTTLKAPALLLLTSSVLLSACDSSTDTKQNQMQQEEIDNKALQAELALQAHLKEVSKPFTESDNPKIYKQWGGEWVGIINTMLPLSVERVQAHQQCDKVMKADIADSSTEGKNPILNIHCQNSENYFVGLNDIANQIEPIPASELFGRGSYEYIELCKKSVKPELQLPETLKTDPKKTSLSSNKMAREVEVTMPFKVKTAYETEVTHIAYCTIDSKSETPKVTQVVWK